MSDISTLNEKSQDSILYSRALATMLVRHFAGIATEDASSFVTDGANDLGIDALAIDYENSHLWVIQVKWSETGNARVSQADSMNMASGIRRLIERDYGTFNSRFQMLAPELDNLIESLQLRISLVVAVAGDLKSIRNHARPLEELCNELNSSEPFVDLQLLGLEHIHKICKSEESESVDLNINLDRYITTSEPYRMYMGTVQASQIQYWYEQYGNHLFARNLRGPLGQNLMNETIARTLLEQPENFLYFNNGVTLTCRSIDAKRNLKGDRMPLELRVINASIVNGAQTVAAIAQAVRQNSNAGSVALVPVRIIEIGDAPERMNTDVVIALNNQSPTLSSDYRALDPVQEELQRSFPMVLGKTYVTRRGESMLSPEEGCTRDEAIVALASCHNDLSLTIQAKLDRSALWNDPYYDMLFPLSISETKVWDAVLLYRVVMSKIDELKNRLPARKSSTVSSGDIFICHLVSKVVLDRVGDDSGETREQRIRNESANVVDKVTSLLVRAVDSQFGTTVYPPPLFRNAENMMRLRRAVLSFLERDDYADDQLNPTMPIKPRKRPLDVASILCSATGLAPGTRLTFRPPSQKERVDVRPWFLENRLRQFAIWTGDASNPLKWEATARQYTIMRLTLLILSDASKYHGETDFRARNAIFAPRYWHVVGQGSLADIAEQTGFAAEGE